MKTFLALSGTQLVGMNQTLPLRANEKHAMFKLNWSVMEAL